MSRGWGTDALDVRPTGGCSESRRMSLSKTRGFRVMNIDTSPCQWDLLVPLATLQLPNQLPGVTLRMQDE